MKYTDIQIQNMPALTLYGKGISSNDRTVSGDIPRLSAQLLTSLEKSEKEVLPFYVLSHDYNETTGDFSLFIGTNEETAGSGAEKLESFSVPAASCAVVQIRPKFGFLWGLAVGEAKRWFYTQYARKQGLHPLNMEYELHTQKTLSKKPSIDLVFVLAS